MLQITNLHFNESDLLMMLVHIQQYMKKLPEGSYKKEVFANYDIFKKIWWELQADTEYFIAESPF